MGSGEKVGIIDNVAADEMNRIRTNEGIVYGGALFKGKGFQFKVETCREQILVWRQMLMKLEDGHSSGSGSGSGSQSKDGSHLYGREKDSSQNASQFETAITVGGASVQSDDAKVNGHEILENIVQLP